MIAAASCREQKRILTNVETSNIINQDSIDSNYPFPDPTKQRIILKQTFSKDSSFHYLRFQYQRNENGDWKSINTFDSIQIWNGFAPNHSDFNGDGVIDFVFLAGRGGRGANYFQHLLLFDNAKKSFVFINGFDQICAPAYDSIRKEVIGTGLSGSITDIRFYKIQGDTVRQVKGEVWEDGVLIKRYNGAAKVEQLDHAE
jgi:hypothetical protein